ncbi:MAG: SMR family transporter [Gammaproteobacteria bacterium]
MTWTAFGLILFSVFLDAVAQFCLKAGVNRIGVIGFQFNTLVRSGLELAVNPWILAGLCCYVVSLIVWLLALSRTAVSLAYPFVSISYILTALAAWAFLGEHMNAVRWIGICVIIFGVFLLMWKS